jgi:GT2 family glycosyltransferase
MGISAGLFWLRRRDFEAIGGFDESVLSAEDVDFARRLKDYGRKRGLRYGTIRKAHIVTSCRKFDIFGDWVLLRQPRSVWKLFRGRNQELADRFFYRVDR